MSRPSNISRALATRLPNEHADRVKAAAELEGTNVSTIIRRAIAAAVADGAL